MMMFVSSIFLQLLAVASSSRSEEESSGDVFVDGRVWPVWTSATDATLRSFLNLNSSYTEEELRSSFLSACLATHPRSVPLWRRFFVMRVGRVQRFVAASVAYNALRVDPMKWDPEEFWRRRRCALSRDSCHDATMGRGLRHPLSLGMLRIVFRNPFDAATVVFGKAFGPPKTVLDTELPGWLARRVEVAGEEIRREYDESANVVAAKACAAMTEALGSRKAWDSNWTPRAFLALAQRFESVWWSEALLYVLRCEFFNSTAFAYYLVAFVAFLARRATGAADAEAARGQGAILPHRASWVRRALLAWDATTDTLSRHEVRVAVFAALASLSWIFLGDALELVRIAQQVAFAAWALRWGGEAAQVMALVRHRLHRLATHYFEARRRRRRAGDDDYEEHPRFLAQPLPPPPLHPPPPPPPQQQDENWREDLAVLGRLVAELLAPVILTVLILALASVLFAPLLWYYTRIDVAKRRSAIDGLLELLAADELPSRRTVFVMNAILVGTTLAPLANGQARVAVAAACMELFVQLKRRLFDKPVPARQPDGDDCCAICLCPFEDDNYDEPQPASGNNGGALVYCRFGCGKAVHEACMRPWLETRRNCVFCGVQWS